MLIAYASLPVDDPGRGPLREQLVTGFLPVARNIATRYRDRGEPFEDLFQVACIGLVHAIDRYRPELGSSFLAFAVPTPTGEVRRHFRDRTWAVRVPRRLKEHHAAVRAATGELSSRLGRAPRPSEIAARLGICTDEVLETLQVAQAYQARSLNPQRDAESESGRSPLDRLGELDPGMDLFTDSHAVAPALAELAERERSILIMRF